MRTLKNIGKYALILMLVAVLIIIVLMVTGPIIGNVFSKVNSSLSGISGSTSLPSSPMPNESSSVKEQLAQIDEVLSQSMQSSFAYNAPESMKLNDTVTMELLLNPSVSASELGNQVTESGAVTTGTLEITPRMKAELIAQDADAFIITQIPEDPIQLMSATDTTQWKWLITAKKGGSQTLTLVVYRLIQYQEQDYWREVITYKTNINVNVTVAQRIQSIDWKWLAGILITALLIPAFWRWIDNRKKGAANQPVAAVSKKPKPNNRKENTGRKMK